MRNFRRTRGLLVVLVVLAFVLITLDYRTGRGSPLDGLRAAAGRVLGPIETGVAAGARPVGRTVTGLTNGVEAAGRADRLARENAALRQQLLLARQPKNADAGAGLIAVAGTARLRIVPARVVGLGAGLGFSWTATIDAGSRDGIRPDYGVVTGAGLAGRVKTVAPATSTVLLAADPAAQVGVRLAGSGEVGVLTGRGSAPMVLDMLAAHTKLRVGQAVATVGSPGARPYPAGIPIGRISKILPKSGVVERALVTPYARFSALDLVGVVLSAPRVVAREAVSPDKPEPVVSEPPSSSRQGEP